MEGGGALLDEVMGEGVGQVIVDGIQEGWSIESLINGIASLF